MIIGFLVSNYNFRHFRATLATGISAAYGARDDQEWEYFHLTPRGPSRCRRERVLKMEWMIEPGISPACLEEAGGKGAIFPWRLVVISSLRFGDG